MKNTFTKISHVTAKKIMDTQKDIIILDVREPDEIEEGYIDGAVFIPSEQVSKQAQSIIPDKEKQILVYCRSGKRSRVVCETLINIGYTKVYDFGGIIDWPFEIVM